MQELTVTTRKSREVLDITDDVSERLQLGSEGSGLCHVFLLHTTAALAVTDLDPGMDLDLLDAYEEMVPQLKYRHAHDPGHVSAHILSATLGTSLTLPVAEGGPQLGTWQRVVLLEFDGPKSRKVLISYLPLP